MKRQLEGNDLNSLIVSSSVDNLSFADFTNQIHRDAGIADFAPDAVCQIDPRNRERIVYNSKRAKRPHDNRPADESASAPAEKPCVICEGKTTGIMDLAPLSEGCTFINKNLFPILYPESKPISSADSVLDNPLSSVEGAHSHGFHFLQWTSSLHHKDWQNMPVEDGAVAISRLGALEKSLLYAKDSPMDSNNSWGDKDTRGYVSIIKNYGRLVGGSLEHGHQQIAYSNIIPKKFEDNLRFYREYGITFSEYMQSNNPQNLMIKDYKNAVLMVPYFMRRPYDLMLFIKNTQSRYLHELNKDEQKDMAAGFKDAISIILSIMPKIGREPAYNVVVHNGPGAGIYVEFLPYTQEWGGYEHAGLILCQSNPDDVTGLIKKELSQFL
jgi:galactose-1-phosphate uridylyltransferase